MTIRHPLDVRDQPAGRRNWRLLVSMGVVFFVLLTLYAAVLGVLLPNQIQNIDPAHKTATLGIVYAITSVFSTLATPLSGALSDRTRSRFGRRTPWIAIGAGVGGGALMLVPLIDGLVMVTLLWLVATVSLNSMQPALTAIVADRFAVAERGVASGVVGAAMTAGVSAGTIFGGVFAGDLGRAYFTLGAAIVVVCTLFVLLNPEPRTTAPPPPRFQLGAFARSFWVSPRDPPDFAWAFAGRFTIYLGYQAVLTYLLYVLQDHIGFSQQEANATIARLSSVTFVALVLSALSAGWLSDRTQRRKPLVFAASIIMAAAVAAPLVAPSMTGMYVYAVLIGIGYGAFMSVDLALMTQVLPKRSAGGETGDETGKDLGILTTAVNVPQILSPVFAAILLTATHNDYAMLFIVSGLLVLAGAFLVLPIRSVR